MCRDCGCEQANSQKTPQNPAHTSPTKSKQILRHIAVAQAVVADNEHIAKHNQQWFNAQHIAAVNIMSAPGSGKTKLLEATAKAFNSQKTLRILVGDPQTDRDAQRLSAAGAQAKQIITHHSCHLNASDIADELGKFVTPDCNLVIIENVGNLVCPASFALGAHSQVALLSCTEGEDKPIKYPHMFHHADAIIINKIDLIPHLDYDRKQALAFIRHVNSNAPIFEISATTGEGMAAWLAYLQERISERQPCA